MGGSGGFGVGQAKELNEGLLHTPRTQSVQSVLCQGALFRRFHGCGQPMKLATSRSPALPVLAPCFRK
eukprot:2931578-Amphidinium_carterae.1